MTFDERVTVSVGLEEEIQRLQDTLKTLNPVSEEYKKVHTMCSELLKIRDSEMKIEAERDAKAEELVARLGENEENRELRLKEIELENQQYLAKIKADKKNFWTTLGIGIAGIVAPLVFNGIWYAKGMAFEENGTYTSTTFKEMRMKNRK